MYSLFVCVHRETLTFAKCIKKIADDNILTLTAATTMATATATATATPLVCCAYVFGVNEREGECKQLKQQQQQH